MACYEWRENKPDRAFDSSHGCKPVVHAGNEWEPPGSD